jgi:hypothetical protein
MLTVLLFRGLNVRCQLPHQLSTLSSKVDVAVSAATCFVCASRTKEKVFVLILHQRQQRTFLNGQSRPDKAMLASLLEQDQLQCDHQLVRKHIRPIVLCVWRLSFHVERTGGMPELALFLGKLHGLTPQGEPDAPGLRVHRGPQGAQALDLTGSRAASHVKQLHGLRGDMIGVMMSLPPLLSAITWYCLNSTQLTDAIKHLRWLTPLGS